MQKMPIDWNAINIHYAQYSPQELESMCQPQRCRICNEAAQCNAALEQSRQEFVNSFSVQGAMP